MTNACIKHEAILASAGSGKTFQLAHRFIRLLAHGVEPNRIIAITFSRKAAGEIFTAIVTHLRAAASSDEAAREVAERIQCPDLRAADFLDVLRRFLNDLQRLHISTIDSFTIGILRAFPLELGIAPGFDVMNNASAPAAQARADALARLFRSQERDPDGQRDLLEAFKQATHGEETKSFSQSFDAFIAEYQEQYKLLPDAAAWGQPDHIWPEGNDWLSKVDQWTEAVELLERHVTESDWDTYAKGKWTEFLNRIRDHQPGMPWADIDYVARRLLEAHDALKDGSVDLKFNRTTYSRSGPPVEWMRQIVDHIMHSYLTASLEATRGIFRLLDRFENIYDAQIRRPGLITFDDAQFLIAQGGQPLSRERDTPARLYIDYRLDSGLDHWLIDEFQDTSDLQWNVFSNLADEILQDAEGRRSFFFVGDVKQAIYAWRGGNHKLFGRILDQYGKRITQRPLNVSFRSSQAVLDVVNQAFDKLPEEIPEATAQLWRRFWKPHQCRTDKAPPTGYAALIEAGETKGDADACMQACADILRTINPLQRGLTAAVLVRKNKTATRIANALRVLCPEIPVAVEGESAVVDNPVVQLLLALIQYAAHPGDTLAREHLRMSPLHADVFGAIPGPTTLLAEIHDRGYKAFLRHWGERLDRAKALDAFGRHRLETLIDAAGAFDETGNRRADDFLAFVREYSVPESVADTTVRIMTVHKSKGLGFDIVIVPDLYDGDSIVSSKTGRMYVARDEQAQPHWALLLPDKAICETDAVLRQETARAKEDGTFENLCALYVALTRAKRGLYLVTTLPPDKPTSLNPAAYLRLQLGGHMGQRAATSVHLQDRDYGVIQASGQADWYMSCALHEPEPDGPKRTWPARFPRKKSKRRRLLQVSPSSRAEDTRDAHLFFMPAVTRSLDLGTAVHGLFEQVDWSDTVDVDDVIQQWLQTVQEPDDEAIAHFRTAFGHPAFQDALKTPDGSVTLWREKMFEAVIDDEWITGTFDRVVIVRNADGLVTRAEILDFKTNDVTGETLASTVDHYRPQLHLYAKALSKLIAYPAESIACKLLFTRPGMVVTV